MRNAVVQSAYLSRKHLAAVESLDEEYDETRVDFSDPEEIVITQIDEHGQRHTVILSAKMIAQYSPYVSQWKSNTLAFQQVP